MVNSHERSEIPREVNASCPKVMNSQILNTVKLEQTWETWEGNLIEACHDCNLTKHFDISKKKSTQHTSQS